MIVVVGHPMARLMEDGPAADGLPVRIALAAATHGRSVQLVGTAGEDPEGDAVVLALAAGGVGHVALHRDAGTSTPRVASASEPEPAAPTLAAEEIQGAATLHDMPDAPALDAADVDLALRYLTEYAVLVLADPADADVVKVVTEAASWIGARLIVVVPFGRTTAAGLPPDAIVFEAPDGDPDGAFASFVGAFAAALDEGDDPGEAFRSSIAADGWAAASD